jgi:hypothetical protein
MDSDSSELAQKRKKTEESTKEVVSPSKGKNAKKKPRAFV